MAPLDALVETLAAEAIARLPSDDQSAPWTYGAHEYFEYRPPEAEFTQLLRVRRGEPADPARAGGPAGRIAGLRFMAELRAWLLDRLGVA